MNHIYKLIRNNNTGAFVAVSEIAKSVGKKTSSGTTFLGACVRFTLKVLVISLMMSWGAKAYALPEGGVVTKGGASISNGAGSTTIIQSTPNAAINWQSFNIGQREAVRFMQPSRSSVALNRVLGSDPSNILGSLSANGQVFLLNPNGVLFGKEAQVNVGGLVASTLNITDGDFMAGRYQFSATNNGTIFNQGSITAADGGQVALLGASVSNEGVISAKLGTVVLAAGNAVTLDVVGDGLLNVTVNQGAVNALVQNGGLIQADGGQVVLTAQSAGNLLRSAVNNTGVIQAQAVENHNGTIILLGDMRSGTVNVSGVLDSSGAGAGQTGGKVTVTGRHVGLFDNAKIAASGDAGGGTVLVGGDLQGANPAVRNASATYMSADSTITADAITNGNGGKVVLWANDSTRAYGNITARGGARGGNGGLIETSGHWLDVAGSKVNAGAPNGKGGLWLLDPADVSIAAATTNGTFVGGVFTPDVSATTATVAVGDIVTALTAGTDVTINTANASGLGSGDITVDSVVTWTKAPGNAPASTLTLTAVQDVIVNEAITATWGNLVATAVRDVILYAPVTTTDGSFTSTAGRDVNIVKDGSHTLTAVTTTRGNLTDNAGRNVNDTTAALTMTTGNVVLSAGNDGTGIGAVVFAAGTPKVAVAGPTSSAKIYNPIGVTTDYAGNFTMTEGATLAQYSYVFAQGLTGPVGPAGIQGIQGITGDKGLQGLQGDIGLTGIQGLQGLQGEIGLTGSQGVPGAQGDIGLTGVQGTQGVQGDIGLTGSQGFPGVQGDIGLTGIQGIQGLQGDVGLTGGQGIQGAQGGIGLTGGPGVQGDIGLTGGQGVQGTQGNIGLTGSQGAQGVQGDIGLTGGQGAQGVQGTQGDVGLTGGQGIQGAQGSIGLTGGQGAQGDIGLTGGQGAQGVQGTQGNIGLAGGQGVPGAQGDIGLTGGQGAQGVQGTQGDIGLTGGQGVQGTQGNIGLTGSQGAQGVQGNIGLTGGQGTQGVQGDVGLTGGQGTQGIQGVPGDIGLTGAKGAAGETTVIVPPEPPPVEPLPVMVSPEQPPLEPAPIIVLPEPPTVKPVTVAVLPEPPTVKPAPVVVAPEAPPVEPALAIVAPAPPVEPKPDEVVPVPPVEPAPVIVAPEPSPVNIYLPPQRPRKQDRN
ncbi:MAG: filamentous hemagglutinin N-terminal domain-containing protein [Syntrophales bacterium]|jgi:filamentous hemagglutinin family protein|nr:filamentous hemagglutinin N-terminal domain-containing protein [Syntrophales bacterium]